MAHCKKKKRVRQLKIKVQTRRSNPASNKPRREGRTPRQTISDAKVEPRVRQSQTRRSSLASEKFRRVGRPSRQKSETRRLNPSSRRLNDGVQPRVIKTSFLVDLKIRTCRSKFNDHEGRTHHRSKEAEASHSPEQRRRWPALMMQIPEPQRHRTWERRASWVP